MPLRAQVDPTGKWLTISTPHFNVHFTAALEDEGRRAAVNAEKAYELLAAELVPPSTKVELIVADNIDYTNGYASVFPYNAIVIFAHPPVDAMSLRNYNDWNQLVVTHELTHIFHLDRSRGIWAFGRKILGRHPITFPNSLGPSWMTEGLAVYYESRLTGGGRLEGSYHSMVARGAASARHIPALPDLSRASTDFPGGEIVYVYGSLIFDYLARQRGPGSIRTFIEESSRSLPFFRNRAVKRAFGMTFETAWKQWQDSMLRAAPSSLNSLAGWRDLTPDMRVVAFPRWIGDTILAVATNGRESLALYSFDSAGARKMIARRNGLDANSRLPGLSIVYSQPEYIDQYSVRNDLYRDDAKGTTQLTHGARISMPDVRGDGEIIAIQATPGSTTLVRVSSDGSKIIPLIPPNVLMQWVEPRWSPDGKHIAAVRIMRGGTSAIVVLDTLGSVEATSEEESGTAATPAWSRDGAKIFFVSDRTGSAQLYSWSPFLSDKTVVRLSSVVTGFLSPEPSPDGKKLAGILFTGGGYHLGVAPLSATPDSGALTARRRNEVCPECIVPGARVIGSLQKSDLPSKRYSALPTLWPRYWEPVITSSSDVGTTIGAATSGNDAIGRHFYYGEADWSLRYHDPAGFVAYRYAGLGAPLFDISLEQSWDRGSLFTAAGQYVGRLDRRDRIGSFRLSWLRPRFRTFSSATIGAELESREYSTKPDTLIKKLPATFGSAVRYPAIVAGAGWLNTQRPSLSISREDGVAVSASVRQRWLEGASHGSTRSIIVTSAGYKSLDLPGFAHHVLAIRAAAGLADTRAVSLFSLGGINGNIVEILPGYSVGNGTRTFGLRGFSPSTERGTRAMTVSAEYRFPIAAPSRGTGWLPLFLDRVSGTIFGDAGRAYCPAGSVLTAEACSKFEVGNPWLGSYGAELNADTGIQRDIPFRFRAGVVLKTVNGSRFGTQSPSVFFSAGSSF